MQHIAVQMYTLREECKKDFLGTLEKVAQIGYTGVEFAGFYNTQAEVLKEHLERLGLKAVASHTPVEELTHNLDEVIAYNKIIGNTNLVCPWAQVKTKEDLQSIIATLQAIIGKIKANGMELHYHNHDHEFVMFEGKYALDLLLEAFNGELKSELDTFWAYRAGISATDYMKSHRENLKFIHLKDGTKDSICSLGCGDSPVKEVIKTAKELGITWLIVENDTPNPDGITDIKVSMTYLNSLDGTVLLNGDSSDI